MTPSENPPSSSRTSRPTVGLYAHCTIRFGTDGRVHVVLATGAAGRSDGFQGWTAEPLPGWESARCAGWDQVATGAVAPSGDVVVVDDLCNAIAPLVAVAVAQAGAASTRIVTRWPMVAMDTILDVYLEWLMPKLYAAGVGLVPGHFVRRIDGEDLHLYNVHAPELEQTLHADWVVMSTARTSRTELLALPSHRASLRLCGSTRMDALSRVGEGCAP